MSLSRELHVRGSAAGQAAEGCDDEVAAVREEMGIVQTACREAVEEARSVHGELRRLKVALMGVDASVKYMLLHCSSESECSFFAAGNSGESEEVRARGLMGVSSFESGTPG